MNKKRIRSITRRINTIIITSLFVGIGGSAGIFLGYMINNYDAASIDNLGQQADILYNTIETLMIPGEAQLAVGYFKKTNLVNPNYEINLFRANEEMAFSDDSTVQSVNMRLEKMMFSTNTERITENLKPVSEFFAQALAPNPKNIPTAFEYKDSESGKIFIQLYRPLQNIYKCWNCHGTNHSIRGVIEIRNNRTEVINERTFIIIISLASFIILIILLIIILTQYLHRIIISPVRMIGAVCSSVTHGDFTQRASINNNDEIAALSRTVNQMVEGLYERFELSKYVSYSTINSLGSNKRGEKIPLTLFFSDIRNFTSYSEKKPPEEVVLNLNKLLNFQTEIIQNLHGDIDKYVGDEIVAVFPEKSPCLSACQAALSIQKELRENPEKYDSLSIGIGINYGEVILGNIGSEKRADYTVIGDNVNTASRLCSAARAGQIIISDSLYEFVKSKVKVKGPYKVKVKGKDKHIKVFILNGLKGN